MAFQNQKVYYTTPRFYYSKSDCLRHPIQMVDKIHMGVARSYCSKLLSLCLTHFSLENSMQNPATLFKNQSNTTIHLFLHYFLETIWGSKVCFVQQLATGMTLITKVIFFPALSLTI